MIKSISLQLLICFIFFNCGRSDDKASLKQNDPNEKNRIRNVELKSDSVTSGLIVSGPIVGAVTETSALFLVKPSQTSPIRVQISEDSSFTNPFYTEEVTPDAGSYNYTKIGINTLSPDTKYFYRAVIGGNITDRIHSFKTFPADKNQNFSFAFGSCQQGRSVSDPSVFPVIAKDTVRFFLHLGDWTYPDYGTPGKDFNMSFEKLDESYKIRYDYSYPFMSEVLSKMPIAYVYDDHEYAGNDEDGTNPYKANSIKAYDMFFPHYELDNAENGIWQKFKYGDVEFFMLDLRSQRNSNDNIFDASGKFTPPEGHSMLSGFKIDGVDQKTWLENSLKNSDAKWKVIVSSVIFNPKYEDALTDERNSEMFSKIRKGIVDKWAGFPEDIKFLNDLIANNNIKNVIMISGDSHTSYIDDGTNSVIPEISSSSLETKNSKLGLLSALAGYNVWNQGSFNDDRNAYGKVSFFYGEEDYALLEIIDDTGASVVSYKLYAK